MRALLLTALPNSTRLIAELGDTRTAGKMVEHARVARKRDSVSTRMTCLLVRFLSLVLALLAFSADALAASPDFAGDAFRDVVPLAGAWHLTAEDLTAPEADAADITQWSTVQVPGKWPGVTGAKRTGVGWCAIDIQLPPSDVRDAKVPELALALPPFLYVFEIYANGERVGQAGRTTPQFAWAPFRHQAFPLPPRVVSDDGLVRLRIRVQNYRGMANRGLTVSAMLRASRSAHVATSVS